MVLDNNRLLHLHLDRSSGWVLRRWKRVHGNTIQRSKRAVSKPLLGDVFVEYGCCYIPTTIRTFDRKHW